MKSYTTNLRPMFRPMCRAVLATLLALAAFTGAYAQSEATTQTFTASDGVAIHYQVQGRGDPVVLLHGITGTAASNWGAAGIIDRLAEEFQVIAVDQRGHGKSDKPHRPGELRRAHGPGCRRPARLHEVAAGERRRLLDGRLHHDEAHRPGARSPALRGGRRRRVAERRTA